MGHASACTVNFEYGVLTTLEKSLSTTSVYILGDTCNNWPTKKQLKWLKFVLFPVQKTFWFFKIKSEQKSWKVMPTLISFDIYVTLGKVIMKVTVTLLCSKTMITPTITYTYESVTTCTQTNTPMATPCNPVFSHWKTNKLNLAWLLEDLVKASSCYNSKAQV